MVTVSGDYKKIEDVVVEECYESLEFVINDSVLESVYSKIPNANPELVKRALNVVINEIIDTWDQTTNDPPLSEGLKSAAIKVGTKMAMKKMGKEIGKMIDDIKDEDEDEEVVENEKKSKSVLKNVAKKSAQKRKLNESAQLGDTVLINKEKGYVIGAIGNDLLVQVQGSVKQTPQSGVKVLGAKTATMKPPIKFDDKTQKVLFEQWIRCGIFENTVPIKTSNCYVRYAEWKKANAGDPVNVIVEGDASLIDKGRIRIFEDVNDFANLSNYIEGVIISQITGDVEENVLINVVDYTDGLGEASPVRIIRGADGSEPQTDTVPKSLVRTTSV